MKIDIIGLQAFVAVADHGGFQKAAEVLNVTQTAVTQRLLNIEAFLGVTLIERTTRYVGLTKIGKDFLPQARRLLHELADVLNEIRETGKASTGNVSLACVPAVAIHYLPAIIKAYSSSHPANGIRILDKSSAGVVRAVLRREAEFGINIELPHHSDLISIPLLQERFVFVCRHDHPLAGRDSLNWSELAGFPLILAGRLNGHHPLIMGMNGAGAQDTLFSRLPLQVDYEVQRSSTAVGLVTEGVAAAVVPGLAVYSAFYSHLKVIPLTGPTVSRTIVLITRKSSTLSPAAQVLFDLIQSTFALQQS